MGGDAVFDDDYDDSSMSLDITSLLKFKLWLFDDWTINVNDDATQSMDSIS